MGLRSGRYVREMGIFSSWAVGFTERGRGIGVIEEFSISAVPNFPKIENKEGLEADIVVKSLSLDK